MMGARLVSGARCEMVLFPFQDSGPRDCHQHLRSFSSPQAHPKSQSSKQSIPHVTCPLETWRTQVPWMGCVVVVKGMKAVMSSQPERETH